MKKWFILILFILISTPLAFAQEEIIDIGQTIFGLDEEGVIIGFGLETGKGALGIKIQFVEEGAFLEINGNKFENIVPNTEEIAYMELGVGEKILLAQFTTNEKGGNYTFNETTYQLTPHLTLYYNEYRTSIYMEKDQKKEGGNFILNGYKIHIPSTMSGVGQYIDIRNNIIGGHRFEIDGHKISKSSGQTGVAYVTLLKNGYILSDEISLLTPDNIRIESGKGNLFYTTSPEVDLSKYDNYILLDDEEITFKSKYNSNYKLELQKNNPYVKIGKKDAPLEIKFNAKGELKLNKNLENSRIPLSFNVEREGSMINIENGETELIFEEGTIYRKPRYITRRRKGSTPVKIDFLDLEGNPYFENTDILMDNKNKLTFLNKNKENPILVVDLAPIIEEIKIKHGINVVGDYLDADLENLKDILDQTDPYILREVKTIKIRDDLPKFVGGRAGVNELDLSVWLLGKDFAPSVLSHEATHVHHMSLMKKNLGFIKESIGMDNWDAYEMYYKGEIDAKKFFAMTGFNKNYLRFLNILKPSKYNGKFEKNWKKVNKEVLADLGNQYGINDLDKEDIYDFGLGAMSMFYQKWKVYDEKTKAWIDVKLENDENDGPKYGFIRPYSGNNIYEDVATIYELYAEDRDKFNEYLEKDKYLRKKVLIMQEYGFFKEEVLVE